MYHPAKGGAFSVVQALQEQLISLPESRLDPEVAEHAIELALSPRRSDTNPAFLMRNVVRDAKRVVDRARRRRRRALDEVAQSPDFAPAAVGGNSWDQPTPEDLAVAHDLEERIRAEARSASPLGERTLDGMLTGEPVAKTAAALGVSPRTVRRVRRSIRAATREIADVPEAN